MSGSWPAVFRQTRESITKRLATHHRLSGAVGSQHTGNKSAVAPPYRPHWTPLRQPRLV